MEDDFDEPAQFSAQTADALREAATQLSEALTRHTERLTALHGGTSEIPALFAAHAELQSVMAAWNEAAFDHTGTFVVPLYEAEEDDYDDADADEVVDLDMVPGQVVSVVSRFDVMVDDEAALLRSGREAHRRNRPEETEVDAEAAVDNLGSAIYAVLHEADDPLRSLEGTQFIGGERRYVATTLEQLPHDEDDEISFPEGELLFGESWR